MEEETVANKKRSLEDSDEEPQAKRLCEDIFFDILNGDDAGEDSGDRDPAAEEVAAVMSSLEEEIGGGLVRPPPAEETVEEYSDLGCSPCQPELGYLLEASDDDLGLPPVTSSEGEEQAAQILSAGESEDSGFGQIWGFDEDVSGFLGGGFGLGAPTVEDGVGFDGGVFDYGEDELFGRSNFSDLSWRPESQPAV